MTCEQLRELTHGGPDVPQCAACNHAAEYSCPKCGELLCGDHSYRCETCDRLHCRTCLNEFEDVFICDADVSGFLAEAAAVMKAERVELAADLRRCQAKLASEYPAEQRIGFAEQMVERWIVRLEASA